MNAETRKNLDAEIQEATALVENLGETVRVVEGERSNVKITVEEDLAACEALLRHREPVPTKGASQ